MTDAQIFDAGAAWFVAVLAGIFMVCMSIQLFHDNAPQWAIRRCSDRYCLKHGMWWECDGEPMNVWAEEYDRREEMVCAKYREASQ